MTMDMCNGIASKEIHVQGICREEGQSRKIVEGLDKTVEDYQQYNWITPIPYREYKRQLKPHKATRTAHDRLADDMAEHGRDTSQLDQRTENSRKYNNFIQTKFQERRHKLTLDLKKLTVEDIEKDPDLGMEPGSGLESPRMELPQVCIDVVLLTY